MTSDVEAARGGDRAALERLLNEHYGRIRGVCRRIVGNDADADDATQEALMAVCRGINRFDGRSSFTTWLYRVSTNAALDELRRKGRRPTPANAESFETTVEESSIDRIVDRDRIEHALARLSPDFRAAVVLRDLYQLDYDDIAATLSIPPGTVRSRIARGRAALARLLNADNLEDPRNRHADPDRPRAQP